VSHFSPGVNDPHEGLRKSESQWPIHQINWQKSRYIYDMYYTYNRISKEVYDYCVNNKLVDAALIAKWKKPGYERLCSTYVINPRNYKFGTVSICRVPKQFLAPGTEIEDPVTGCRGCASGSNHNIFGNKYGQYLAAIQIAREERQARKAALLRLQQQREEEDDDEEEEKEKDTSDNRESESDDDDPVANVDGSSDKPSSLWTNAKDESKYVSQDMIGELAPEAKREAMAAASKAGTKHTPSTATTSDELSGPPGKRSRPH
jgi:bud site selection protein 31